MVETAVHVTRWTCPQGREVRVEAASRVHGEPRVALKVLASACREPLRLGAPPSRAWARLQRQSERQPPPQSVFSCLRATRVVTAGGAAQAGSGGQPAAVVQDVWIAWRAFLVLAGCTRLRLAVTQDPARGEVRFRLARPGAVLRRAEGAWRVKGFTGVARHEGGADEVLEESCVSLSYSLRLARAFAPLQPLVGVIAAKTAERACEELAAEMQRRVDTTAVGRRDPGAGDAHDG